MLCYVMFKSRATCALCTGFNVSRTRRLQILVRTTNKTASRLRQLLETVLVSNALEPTPFQSLNQRLRVDITNVSSNMCRSLL